MAGLIDLIQNPNANAKTNNLNNRLVGKLLNQERDRVKQFYYTVGKSTAAGITMNRHTVWEKNPQERVDRIVTIDKLNNEIDVQMAGVKWTSESNGANLEHAEIVSFNREDFKRIADQVNDRLDYSFSDNMAGAKKVVDNIGEYEVEYDGQKAILYRAVIAKHSEVAVLAMPFAVKA